MAHQTPLLCPRCQHALFAGETRGSTIYGCGHCGGVWLDQQTSAQVIDSACQTTIQMSQRAAQNRQNEVDDSGQHQLKCPVCGQTMRTQRRANAWLDVDECEHGVWYDSGELERVARAAKRGTSGDWRTQNKGGHSANSAATMGVAAGGAAMVGAAGVAGVQHGVAGNVAENMLAGATDTTFGDVALEIAGDTAAEIAFEGLFALIGAFFD